MKLKLILAVLLTIMFAGTVVSASELESISSLNQDLILLNSNEAINHEYSYSFDDSTCIIDKELIGCYANDYDSCCIYYNMSTVANIGEREYNSLQQAVDDAKNGDIIEICDNIEIDTTINIKNKTVTFVNTSGFNIFITRKQGFTGPLFCVSNNAEVSFGENPTNRKQEQSRIVLDGQNIPNCESLVVCQDSNLCINYGKLCNNITRNDSAAMHAMGESNIVLGADASIHSCMSDSEIIFIDKSSTLVSCGGMARIYRNFSIKGKIFNVEDGATVCLSNIRIYDNATGESDGLPCVGDDFCCRDVKAYDNYTVLGDIPKDFSPRTYRLCKNASCKETQPHCHKADRSVLRVKMDKPL